jgi:serine/threonine-protein kinase
VNLIRGKYRIVREIARSNDIVYEAVDERFGRRIAIKELNIAPALAGQARRERIERFNREARAAGRLSHPNIVSVFDFGEENGRHFIAMEFLEGQTLRDIMQVRGALPMKEALDIACQMLDALAYAHANRVIHRDIKPDNIHILPGGQVKLTDFGIARLTEEPALTNNGQVFGTPSYMSPEQIEGKEIDSRSDLFSLAVVLYEMLAGRKPFLGDSVISITYAVMNAEPAFLSGVPAGVDQVTRRALSKNPLGRQTSAEQMKLDLRNAEQTPAIFLPPQNQTGMGSTGMSLSFPGMGASPGGGYGGYAGGSASYGSMTNSSYPPMPSASMPSVPPDASMPWAFNTPGGGGGANAGPFGPMMPPQASQGTVPPMTGAGSANPYAAPPFPTRKPEPLFVLTPGGRSFLLALLLVMLLGGGIGLGVVAFMRSYETYSDNVSTKRVVTLINQGVAAYNARNYTAAASFFEQARAAQPTLRERDKIDFNLVATYVQLGRQAEANGKWEDARQAYSKALAISPDDRNAHQGLANVLAHLGDTQGARQHRSEAQSSDSDAGTPATLDSHAPGSGDPGTGEDAQQFVSDRRSQALQLIREGDQLESQGNHDGARARWQQAIAVAPATPERDEAQDRLNRGQNVPDFGDR